MSKKRVRYYWFSFYTQYKKGTFVYCQAKVISAKVEVAPSASCSVCGGNEDEDCIILCDTEGCKTETHMYCLIPPLFKVPDDNWYCENCSLSKNGAGNIYICFANPTWPA